MNTLSKIATQINCISNSKSSPPTATTCVRCCNDPSGNLQVNIGPTHERPLPAIMEERSQQVDSWLEANGRPCATPRSGSLCSVLVTFLFSRKKVNRPVNIQKQLRKSKSLLNAYIPMRSIYSMGHRDYTVS